MKITCKIEISASPLYNLALIFSLIRLIPLINAPKTEPSFVGLGSSTIFSADHWIFNALVLLWVHWVFPCSWGKEILWCLRSIFILVGRGNQAGCGKQAKNRHGSSGGLYTLWALLKTFAVEITLSLKSLVWTLINAHSPLKVQKKMNVFPRFWSFFEARLALELYFLELVPLVL